MTKRKPKEGDVETVTIKNMPLDGPPGSFCSNCAHFTGSGHGGGLAGVFTGRCAEHDTHVFGFHNCGKFRKAKGA